MLASYVRLCYLVRTMIKKLTKTGNSLALVLDRPLLEQVGVDAQTELEISTDGEVIVLSPVRNKKRVGKIKKILNELDEQYAGVFQRLAK